MGDTFIQRLIGIIGPEFEILAFALRSQGFATAPNAIVLYRQLDWYICHGVNFETNSLSGGGYHATAKAGLEDFAKRLEMDMTYIQNGIPLTGEPQ